MEMYAFALDEVGRTFVRALSDAGRRGVRVRVILDGWGSRHDGSNIVAELEAAGCVASMHNPFSRIMAGKWGCNHRKLLVVDERTAFVGGINIGKTFETWEDLAVVIHGPACANVVRRGRRSARCITPPSVRILMSGFGAGGRLRLAYLDAIRTARERIVIAHSYFLPDAGILRALRKAARRGVKVTLLLPHESDVPIARLGTTELYRRLLRAKVMVYERWGRILHTKVAIVDGQLSLVGSFNLDPLSLTNLEVLVRIHDARFGAELEQWVVSRLQHARLVTQVQPGLQSAVLEQIGRGVRALGFLLVRGRRGR